MVKYIGYCSIPLKLEESNVKDKVEDFLLKSGIKVTEKHRVISSKLAAGLPMRIEEKLEEAWEVSLPNGAHPTHGVEYAKGPKAESAVRLSDGATITSFAIEGTTLEGRLWTHEIHSLKSLNVTMQDLHSNLQPSKIGPETKFKITFNSMLIHLWNVIIPT